MPEADVQAEIERLRRLLAFTDGEPFDPEPRWRALGVEAGALGNAMRSFLVSEDEARRGLDALREGWRQLHDRCADYQAGLLTFVARRFGEAALEEAFRHVLEPYLRERYGPFDVRVRPYEETVFRNAYLSYEAMRGHLCGEDRRGDIDVEEDDDKIVIAFDPCGSGGRQQRGDLVEGTPPRAQAPYEFGVTTERHDWAWNEQGVCYYCAHCCFALERWPAEQWGHPVRVVDSPLYPDEAQGPSPKKCTWTIYKSLDAIPAGGLRADRAREAEMSWSVGAGLEGKGVVVTGAAGGIGSEVARAFAEAGARVCAVDVKEDALASLMPTLAGGPHRSEALDLRDLAAHDGFLRRTAEEFGSLDVLANVAAVLIRRNYVDEVTEEDWDFQHDVNLKAGFFLNRAAAGIMREQGRGGRIINFTSQGWWTGGFGGSVVYSATKGGIVSMCRGLARTYAKDGITVNIGLAGRGRHADDARRAHRRAAAGQHRHDPARLHGAAVRPRRDGRLPGVRPRPVHHRRDDQRQRRLAHVLMHNRRR